MRAKALVLSFLLVILALGLGVEAHSRKTLHPPPDPSQWSFIWPPLERSRFVVSEPIPGFPVPVESLVTTNSLGLRGAELDLSVRERKRILVLGGSVTQCVMLSDGLTWADQLQERLTERGFDVWVGNGGRGGQATLDYMLHIQQVVPALKPDLVIVMPGANDLQAAMEDRYFPVDLTDARQRERMAAQAYPHQGEERLQDLAVSHAHFLLNRWWTTKRSDVTDFYRAKKQQRATASKKDDLPDRDLLLELYEANLSLLATSTEGYPGTELLLLTHPHLWTAHPKPSDEASFWGGYTCLECEKPSYYSAAVVATTLNELNRLTMAACEGTPSHCFDLDGAVDRSSTYFYDGAHLTAAGAARVAESLADFLVGSELL